MQRLVAWIKRGLAIAVLGGLVPLYLFANIQSLTDYAGRQGLSTISGGGLAKVMAANALIMWWKILGAIPTSSLVPGMGQNWVALGETRQSYKWGGCSLIYNESEDLRSFTFAKGFARCSGVSETTINPAFSALSDEQRALLQEIKFKLSPGEYGPRDYEEVAYAIMTEMETMGVGHSKRVIDKICAKAYLGIQSARLDCFALQELVETLDEVTPRSETERRAVAVKAGGSAWFWALADEKLGAQQLSSLWRLGAGGAKTAQQAGSFYAQAAQWRTRYAGSEEGRSRFSVMALSREWKPGDLDELNQFLHLRKKRVMDKKYWDEATAEH